MKTTIPPSVISIGSCAHELAGARDHRCPSCRKTLRRCCASVIGDVHHDLCRAVLEHAGARLVEQNAAER